MNRTADALTATFAQMHPGEGRRPLEPWESDTVQAVLDAAQEWADGHITLNDAAHCGILDYDGHPSPRYSRLVAITTTPRTDPRWPSLYELVCTITDAQYVVTKAGLFTRDELHQHDRARDWLRQHDERRTA
jgi:hypothetical protein